MNWLIDLFTGTGVAHSILILALTISLGIPLGRIKVANISLGITWILFVGIALSHFGIQADPPVLHFIKEFGLILFVYSIGLQVGPGFFSSLRKGGLSLNLLAVGILLLGAGLTVGLHALTHTPLSTMVGVMSGAVTNTPGLGAAQQTFTEVTGQSADTLASGYAVAYPFGVLGVIAVLLVLRPLCHVKAEDEQKRVNENTPKLEVLQTSYIVENQELEGITIALLHHNQHGLPFVVARIKRADGTIEVTHKDTMIHLGDTINIVTDKGHIPHFERVFGHLIPDSEEQWETPSHDLVSKRIVITRPSLNGQRIGRLQINELYGVNITRVYRAGLELVATPHLLLQMGDRVTVVGNRDNINKLGNYLGNSMKRLDIPNLVPIFLGIFLGIIVGSIPIFIPGIPQPIKFGMAGGPLVVAILMARYGPLYKMITFTTSSANMMLRETGISLFLAAVGLEAGNGFVDSIVQGGYWWILFSLIIAIVPTFIIGVVARLCFKLDYYTIMGMISGSCTNPPALAFANGASNNDLPSVAYATVYPLTMFLRVLTAQILIVLGT